MAVQPARILQEQRMKTTEGSEAGSLDGDAIYGRQQAQQAAGSGKQEQPIEPLQEFEVPRRGVAQDRDIHHQRRRPERGPRGLGLTEQQLVHLCTPFAQLELDAVLLLADTPGEFVEQRHVETGPAAKAVLEVQLSRHPREIPGPQATHHGR
jgi:hypothetical protein